MPSEKNTTAKSNTGKNVGFHNRIKNNLKKTKKHNHPLLVSLKIDIHNQNTNYIINNLQSSW